MRTEAGAGAGAGDHKPRKAWSQQKLQEAGKDPPIESVQGSWSCHTLMPDSGLQDCERRNVLF